MIEARQGVRVGPYLVLVDTEGRRHAVRVGAVTALSDSDPCQDETVVQIGARSFVVRAPLDEVIGWLGWSGP